MNETMRTRLHDAVDTICDALEEFAAHGVRIVPKPRQPRAPRPTPKQPAEVPEALKSMTLYSVDAKLCTRWAEAYSAWRDAYPGVDVLAEVAKAHAWEVANPKRRKTNRLRFLDSWMSRAQDRGRGRGGNGTACTAEDAALFSMRTRAEAEEVL